MRKQPQTWRSRFAPEATTGIVLFAHGSGVEEAKQGVRDLAQRVRDAGPGGFVCAAFLKLAQPDLIAAAATW